MWWFLGERRLLEGRIAGGRLLKRKNGLLKGGLLKGKGLLKRRGLLKENSKGELLKTG
jgi:hypothetical protein